MHKQPLAPYPIILGQELATKTLSVSLTTPPFPHSQHVLPNNKIFSPSLHVCATSAGLPDSH